MKSNFHYQMIKKKQIKKVNQQTISFLAWIHAIFVEKRVLCMARDLSLWEKQGIYSNPDKRLTGPSMLYLQEYVVYLLWSKIAYSAIGPLCSVNISRKAIYISLQPRNILSIVDALVNNEVWFWRIVLVLLFV